jgi:hypothetical protein
MKIRAGPQPFVQIIFVFLSAAKSDKFLGDASNFFWGLAAWENPCRNHASEMPLLNQTGYFENADLSSRYPDRR